MATHEELSSRYPDVLFTDLPPGTHGTGAVWEVRSRGSDTIIMYAHTDDQADRYAKVVARAVKYPGQMG
ncbi:hypothetical protein [Nocardiopsis sp. RV163]|uniref:hypothetical protein n=1 Tax=Nocardiopsis sp. RV163 TaxID=1661388 RepID=UPI00064BBED6|nr:hypothetical protein [Nocardiopsis sp. RV163]